MKYIYFGAPEFAADILSALVRGGMTPVAVVTNPDRPRGRKKIMTPPAVKSAMLGCGGGADILQPEVLDDVFIATLARYGAEVGVLAAYGKIIPPAVFSLFPKGIVVVHPSLLPKYRGATPIQAVILEGDRETGTTLFVMDKKVDHGSIIGQRNVLIANTDTYTTLAKKLAVVSAELLCEVLPAYVAGDGMSRAQDESQASYTKKLTSQDGYVDPQDFYFACHPDEPYGEEGSYIKKYPPEKIWRMVRALNPEPGVWTMQDGRRMKILEADVVDGKLAVKRIQFEGEKVRGYLDIY